jgi:cell division protein FtsI (penicillin-binding protein 3)
MGLAFGVLGLRAAYIQVVANDFFLRQGVVRFTRTLELPASRGRILDRNGLIMASSVPALSIWAIPEDVQIDKKNLQTLSRLLEIPQDELSRKLEAEGKNFVWIKRQVNESIAKQVTALGIKGIYQRKEYKREYPEGEAAAHVLGMTNVEEKGQEGIELAFDEVLAGRTGSRRVIKDRMGRVVEDGGNHIPPVSGQDVQLSIDSKIQFFAYQKLRDAVLEHKAKAGSIVVLDVVTGEVLALANYPSFDPNKRRSMKTDQLRNRALTDIFEPGSVMKPFTIALALETKRVGPQSLINTAPGRITLDGFTISDTHANGTLTVEGVIQKSSNVGTTRIAMQMPAEEMWQLFSAAGFGQKPQLHFPGVVSGRLRPAKTWRRVEQATMSYGYGMSASLFQMARSYTIFAHDGSIIPVTILKNATPVQGTPVLSPKTASQVRKMLQMAAGPNGTGQRAQTEGYTVGGKSGTAYKHVGKGYGDEKNRKYRGWFVGLAPIETPRVVVAVMIDEPTNGHYGGVVAAPVFSETVQQTLRLLGVPPDMAVRPQIISQPVPENF